MAIDRTNYNALDDDDGTNTVGTLWTKDKVKTVILDPVDAEFTARAAVVRGVAAGGTGAATLTAHGVLVGEGTGAVVATSAGTATQVLTSNGAAADPTFQAVPADATKAPLASPTFTGVPAAPTAAPGTNTTQLATTAFVDAARALLATLASPTFTGTPAAPTASPGTNTTQLATTAFVEAVHTLLTAADALLAPLASPTLTGTPAAPTAAVGTNTTQLATTAFALANWPGGVVGNLSFPATQVPSAGANVLDDYEEGTWTPIDSSGASLSFTSNWTALYTKIGRVVYVVFGITYPATASGATATLGGLPFTSGGGGGQQYSLVTTYSDYGAGMLNFIAGAGTTVAFFSLAAVALTNANLSGKTIRASGFYFV